MKKSLLIFVLFFAIKAISQSGEIDASFGENGKVTTGFGTNSNYARCVAFQTDGKLIVGGNYLSSRGDNDFALARYNPDGSLDLSFGIAGKAVTNFLEINNTSNYMLSLCVLPNGKILAMGMTAQSIGSNVAIVRYNENGSIDTGFGTNGKIVSEFSPMSLGGFGGSVAVQPDGKIVVAGVKRINFDPKYYTGLERYNEDGSPDTAFGTAGQVYSSYGNGKSFPSSVALQPDGKIVVGGTYMQTNAPSMAVMRFNANGTLDTTFSGDGKVTTTFGTGMYSDGMQISVENGKIILAGITTSNTSRNFSIVRYLANGNLDTTFDTDGKALTPFDLSDSYSLVNSISKQPDGKYLAIFKSDDYLATSSDFVVRRYNADTSPDSTFGTNGKISTGFDSGLNEAQSASVSPDGKIYLVGQSIPLAYDHADFGVARYSTDGVLDTTFDSDGKVTTTFEKGNDKMSKLFVLPNDKILAVGISDYRNANNSTARDIILSKYNSDGSLDNSFGNSGKVLSVLGQQLNTITASAVQSDGKIAIGNMYYVFGQTSYSYEVVRYQANGNLDTAFGTNGKQALAFLPESIIFQPDGKLVVGGSDGAISGYQIARFNVDGSPDTGFATNGSTTISFGEYNSGRSTILLQPDGKIIISGSASDTQISGGAMQFVLARFSNSGILDTTFGANGIVKTLVEPGGGFAYAAFLMPDGKILVAGRTFSGSGAINFSSIRYQSNGQVDATYGSNGVSSSNLWYDYKEINSVVLQPDGKLVVALSLYNEPQNSYDFKLRRFNPDSTYDLGFGEMYGITTSFYNGYDEAFSVGLQSDDKIVVGGTTHNGINYDFALTRLENSILDVEENAGRSKEIVLFPNPVKDILHVKSPNGFDVSDYRIYSISGQIVSQGTDVNSGIDVSNLSNGLYVISIKTRVGTINRKFVK